MATKLKLSKELLRSSKKVQKRFTKAFEKSYAKHQNTERAYKKAYKKLSKKYELVGKKWVSLEEGTTQKAESKKKDSKKKQSQKTSKKDAAPSKTKKKADEGKSAQKKKAGKKKSSGQKPQKSKSDDLLLEILSAEDLDAELDAEMVEDELLGLDRELEAVAPEITDIGAYEGAHPEEMEDPVAAQEALEDSFASADLAAVLDEEVPATEVGSDVLPEENALVQERRTLAEVTRAELYREAQALKIPGRSNMSKEELFKAVEALR